MKNTKQVKQARRKARVRAKVSGTASFPRLSVFRSNRGMYVQLIDDQKGQTIVSAHSKELKEKADKTSIAAALGKLVAKKAIEKKIESVTFDRSSYKYHGRVKALADGAREGGLKF